MRAAGLLAALTAAGAVGFCSAAPSSDAAQTDAPPAAAAAPPAVKAPDGATCKGCHQREIDALAETAHRGAKPAAGFAPIEASSASLPGLCEGCHGAISEHGDTASEGSAAGLPPLPLAKKLADERSAPCLACHAGSLTGHWPGSVHEARDVSCTDCHTIHPPGRPLANLPAKADEVATCIGCHLTVAGSRWRSSRHPVREGRMLCSGCHEPHGTLAEAQLRRPTVNETCLECHAEKRGPFVWTHPPVAENCLNCHEPHGSLHKALLIMQPPRLCQSCHLEPQHVSSPHNYDGRDQDPNRFVFNRGCDNCHEVHGSNSPSGATLLR